MEIPGTFFNPDAQHGGFYPLSHVGIDINSFCKNQNALIEGIRGSGKTHVLKMLQRHYFENYDSLHILPIYVSVAGISEHARKDPEEFRLHLYVNIVHNCLETIETHLDTLQKDKNQLENAINVIKDMFGFKVERDVKDILSTLKLIANELEAELSYNLTDKTYTSTFGNEDKRSSTIGGSLDFQIPQVLKSGIDAKITETRGTNKKLKDSARFLGNRLSHHNAVSFILEFLKQVQILLNLEYSLLLLDECSVASLKSQVEIFRLFKTIRDASSRLPGKETCAYFIGSVYPRGQTYYPTIEKDEFNFDPGHDCAMEFLQRDESDIKSYISFYKDMTLKRAKEILGFKGDFIELCRELFDREEAFTLAAFCANGLPRRYLDIIKKGYDQSLGKILFDRVSIGTQEIINDQILSHPSITDNDINFVYFLVNVLSKQNAEIRRKNYEHNAEVFPQNIYFSVPRKYRDKFNVLIMQGAIHDKARMRTISRPVIRPQPIYSIDIGLAYTYRIIPINRFINILINDIPRCPINNFDHAPQVYIRVIKEIYDDGVKINIDNSQQDEIEFQQLQINQIIVNVEDRKELEATDKIDDINKTLDISSVQSNVEGIIRTYQPNNYGLIDVLDSGLTEYGATSGSPAYFSSENVSIDFRDSLQVGDRVLFDLLLTPNGKLATNIIPPELPVFIQEDQLHEISDYVINYVKSSDIPIEIGTLSVQMRNYFGDRVANTQWFGYRKFKNMLQHLDLHEVAISQSGPGYIYDSIHHSNFIELMNHSKGSIQVMLDAIKIIKSVVKSYSDENGWIEHANFINKIRKEYPKFDYKKSGYHKFGEFVEATGTCIIESRPNPKNQKIKVVFYKLKE
jgi:hypothetical protein